MAYILTDTLINDIKNNCFFRRKVRLLGPTGAEKAPVPGQHYQQCETIPMSETMAIAFGEALAANTAITELDLEGLRFANMGAVESLAKGLQKNRSLKILSLEGCEIDNSGAKYIAAALKENTTLENLNLCSNKIDHLGLIYLAKSLTRNNTLLKLDLNFNNHASKFSIPLFYSINHGADRVTSLNLEPESKLNEKDLVLNYLFSWVVPILAHEKTRLKNKYKDKAGEREVILSKTISDLYEMAADFYEKPNSSSADFKAFKEKAHTIISNNIINHSLDKYKDWGKKLGRALLNILITVLPEFLWVQR